MIEAFVFDLDGTLVQTEKLKALSYAKAAVALCPSCVSEEEVMQVYKEVVGLSRREVATTLVERFDLSEKAAERMAEFGVSAPWQAFIQVRLKYYEDMLSNPQVIRQNQWPHNVKVLEMANRLGCKTGLATMSRCQQAKRILEILELASAFDFIATRDDVNQPKPDPEIYNLVASHLGVDARRCLVLEDSPSGVQAGLAAGMLVVAVATPFTREGLTKVDGLGKEWIVTDPEHVEAVIDRRMRQA